MLPGLAHSEVFWDPQRSCKMSEASNPGLCMVSRVSGGASLLAFCRPDIMPVLLGSTDTGAVAASDPSAESAPCHAQIRRECQDLL